MWSDVAAQELQVQFTHNRASWASFQFRYGSFYGPLEHRNVQDVAVHNCVYYFFIFFLIFKNHIVRKKRTIKSTTEITPGASFCVPTVLGNQKLRPD